MYHPPMVIVIMQLIMLLIIITLQLVAQVRMAVVARQVAEGAVIMIPIAALFHNIIERLGIGSFLFGMIPQSQILHINNPNKQSENNACIYLTLRVCF